MNKFFKYFAMFAAVAMFTACSDDDNSGAGEPTPDPEQPAAPAWQLVWEDGFDTAELDPTVWHKCDRGTPDWCNNMSHEEACYGWDESGAVVLRGIVTPEGAVAPDGKPETWEYIVGGIETSGLKSFVPPFRIEMRVKMTGAQGAWPAIWMMPWSNPYGWPACGEIDIIERLNKENMVYHTVHFGNPANGSHESSSTTAMINGDDWNIFQIQVSVNDVVWKVNGRETHRYKRNPNQPDWRFPFNQAWHLKMDMQLGGSWVGHVNTADLPCEMLIDYVKYYRYF